MTDTKSKIRALFLAGLMVLSVFAGTIALTGTAVAETTERGEAQTDSWDTTAGEGNVGDNGVVFQGEDDITFVDDDDADSTVDPELITNGDGDPLSMPIDEDTDRTSYSGGGMDNIIVRNPTISDHEFRLAGPDGADVSGGQVPRSEDTLTVWAEYNFGQAEDLDITVEDADGVDVTNEAVDEDQTQSALQAGPSDEVMFNITLGDLETGEYTVSIDGTDDLDSNDATVSDTFTISSARSVSLSLDQSEVVQGENVRYDIEGGTEGDYHVVSVSGGDVRDDASAEDVFRNVGDTTDVATNRPAALVEIDGGTGVGSIETSALDTTDIEVSVSEAVDSDFDIDADDIPADEDDQTLTVTEGTVELENPSDFYVPGAEVTVNGTTSAGISDVSLWARDQGDFYRVQLDGSDAIDVTDGEFEEEDVRLSDGNYRGNRILSLPGSYRFAILGDDPRQGDDSPVTQMTNTQIAQNVSQTYSLRVSDADLEANATIINGQVATADDIDVSGVAPGARMVNVTMFGPRGTVDSVSGITVRNDGTFEREGISVGGNLDAEFTDGFSEISQGNVVMSVGHAGRDGVRGDGTPPELSIDVGESTLTGFSALVYRINTNSFTQQQAIERMSAQTSDDVGSDDQSQSFQFRLTNARTTVDNVTGEAGTAGQVSIDSEMSVEGTTNRQPEDTTITVEVISGPSQQEFDLATTEQWGTNGQWNASLNTSGLQPGTYTVEADDGESSDVMEFELVEGQPDTDTPDTDTPDTETEAPGTETETEAPDTDTNETGGDTDGQDGPGFGIAVALVALLAAALLAVRRNN